MTGGEADAVVSAEPRTNCIHPRIIRLEGHAAGIALKPIPFPPASNTWRPIANFTPFVHKLGKVSKSDLIAARQLIP